MLNNLTCLRQEKASDYLFSSAMARNETETGVWYFCVLFTTEIWETASHYWSGCYGADRHQIICLYYTYQLFCIFFIVFIFIQSLTLGSSLQFFHKTTIATLKFQLNLSLYKTPILFFFFLKVLWHYRHCEDTLSVRMKLNFNT